MHKFLWALLPLIITSTPAKSESADSIVRVGACATPGQAFGVHIQGEYAYIADGGRLTVVNVAEPTNPYVVSNLVEDFVYPVGVFLVDTIIYNNNGFYSEFSTVSVADPENLYRLGWCLIPTTGVQPKGIAVSNTDAYLAHGTKGVQIINVSQPDSPEIIIAYDTPGWTMDLRVRDTLLYIADWDSLQIASITSPDSPFRVGACSMPTGCWDVDVKDTFAYVVCQSTWGYDGRLVSVNISDPSNPTELDVVYMNGDPIAVFVQGNYAYVAAADYWAPKGKKKREPFDIRSRIHPNRKADVEGGLRIVNIGEPDSMELIASYDTPGWPEDVFVVGDLVYIADEDSLQILRHLGVGIEEEADQRLETRDLKVLQNYPNPFTSITHIGYQVANFDQPVILSIYDITGKLVRRIINKAKSRSNEIIWDGRNEMGNRVVNGIYFYQLTNGPHMITKKLVVVH